MRAPVRGRWPWIVMGTSVVVVCAAAIVVSHLAAARSAASLNQLQQQVQLLQAQTQPMNMGSSAQEETAAQQIVSTSVNYDIILDAFARDLPPGTTVDAMQQTGSSLTISGRSGSVASVAAFEAALAREPFTASASFSAAALESGGGSSVPAGAQPAVQNVGHAIVAQGGGSSERYAYTLTLALKSGGAAP